MMYIYEFINTISFSSDCEEVHVESVTSRKRKIAADCGTPRDQGTVN